MIPLNTSATQSCRRPCHSRLRRLAPLLLAATAAFLSLFSPIHGFAGEEGRLPNVVLVITDDQGYGDLSCLGNPVLKTPNLDKLYAESVRLTDYHVAPTCSPTRAALLTGRWSNRTGVWHTIMGRSMLRENEVTMGQIFQDAGYATGMFGKWHLGDNYPYRPEDRGFAEVIRHGGGGVGQTPDYWDNAYFDGSYFYNGRSEPVEGFCTDVWFDYAQRYILAQKQAGKPFFAYISTNAPHGPMHAPESSSQPYQHLGIHVANFFGMIANIDDQVGQLRTMLDREGLTENTIFIFTTDNGTSSGAKVFNAGMRGQKGSQYDGGHRVPFFLHWPAGGLVGGRDVKPIAAHVDVLPTLIDLCGIPAPQNVRFDGRSLRPLLEGRTEDGSWPDRILVTDSQRVKDPIKWKQSAVMTSRWRLVNGSELYDIQADPGQQRNVAAEHPEVIARLRAFYEDWWTELEPTFQQATPIHLGHPAENPATLTCHDWITSDLTPWHQGFVRRAMGGEGNTGFWNVQVVADGNYEIRLRRWPVEIDRAIRSDLAPGDAVPGERAFRTEPGKAFQAVRATILIGEVEYQAAVPADAKEAVFRLPLTAGTTTLSGRFYDAAGDWIGAYYAYVEKF
jgi:arylsulfatase A-like enzyme